MCRQLQHNSGRLSGGVTADYVLQLKGSANDEPKVSTRAARHPERHAVSQRQAGPDMFAAPAGPPRASRSPCVVGRSPVTQSNDMRALLRPRSSSTPRHCGNSRRLLSPPTNSTSWLPRPPVSIRLAPAEIGGAEVVLADQLHTRAGRACLFGRLADAPGHPAAAIAARRRSRAWCQCS